MCVMVRLSSGYRRARFASLVSACALSLGGCTAAERAQPAHAGLTTATIVRAAGLSETDAERVVTQAIVAHEVRRP
jgi:hypothetical protein